MARYSRLPSLAGCTGAVAGSSGGLALVTSPPASCKMQIPAATSLESDISHWTSARVSGDKAGTRCLIVYPQAIRAEHEHCIARDGTSRTVIEAFDETVRETPAHVFSDERKFREVLRDCGNEIDIPFPTTPFPPDIERAHCCVGKIHCCAPQASDTMHHTTLTAAPSYLSCHVHKALHFTMHITVWTISSIFAPFAREDAAAGSRNRQRWNRITDKRQSLRLVEP